AQARIRINEKLEGLSVDAEVKALDNVREHIKNTIAEANLGAELKSTALDQRLQGLRQASGDVTAKQQLAELKAAAAAKKATQKTLWRYGCDTFPPPIDRICGEGPSVKLTPFAKFFITLVVLGVV